ncbi:MAG: hypothetical protein KatS3mg102_2668 [Planctomycetota bacterium]|nr:MAG: hypothetical protein KatS3mg102_2668 [Planctomycetota bacterium]
MVHKKRVQAFWGNHVPGACGAPAIALRVVAGLLLFAMAPRLHAQEQPRPLVVAPGELAGQVLEPGTFEPVGGAHVRLLDEHGAPIASGFTDAEGRFALGLVGEGSYRLVVGRARGKLLVVPGAQASKVIVLVARRHAVPEQQTGAGGGKAPPAPPAAEPTPTQGTEQPAAAAPGPAASGQREDEEDDDEGLLIFGHELTSPEGVAIAVGIAGAVGGGTFGLIELLGDGDDGKRRPSPSSP